MYEVVERKELKQDILRLGKWSGGLHASHDMTGCGGVFSGRPYDGIKWLIEYHS